MFDPVTITAVMSVATTAFQNLKKGFSVAKDIQSMQADLSNWMQASSDILEAEKNIKNPPFYKKFLSGDSVEQAAVKIFTSRKQLEEQRYSLQQHIKFMYGSKAWDDLLALEGQIRKDRTAKIYARQKLKQQIIEGIFVFILLLTVIGFIGFVIWLKKQQEQI